MNLLVWSKLSGLLVFLPHLVFSQVNFTSSNLPIIVINTNGQTIVDEPKIEAMMGIIYNGPGVRNNATDPFNNYNGKIGIEIRGSSSQMFPKKQYGIELHDATGSGIDVSLLGLPKKDDWVLFAPYNDKTLLRDVLAYKLGRDLGRYASRSVYCEVILNGQYQGIYVLLEKVKRDKNRVNIEKLDPVETSGENLTGGYIIKIDKVEGSGGQGWNSSYPPPGRKGSQTTFFQYEYPKQEDIVSEQKAYIRNFVTAFEDVLAGENFKDPVNGYAKYIDVNSFVDYFIANEVSRNPDAYRISTFLYKQKDAEGGKLSMGPIWDFNLGFGNVDFCAKEKPEGLIIDYNFVCPDDGWLVPFWWRRLFEDPAFKEKVITRWQSLRSSLYQTSRVTTYIDSVANVLNMESQQRNFQRWPVLGQYVWPNSFVGNTFQSEIDWLKQWLTKRFEWLDLNLPNIVTGLEPAINRREFSLDVHPNPSEGPQSVSYVIDGPGVFLLDVFQVTGRCILTHEQFYERPGEYTTHLPLLPAGIYVVRGRFGEEVRIRKVIRQ